MYRSDREKLQVNHFEGVERVLLLLLIDVDRDKTKKPWSMDDNQQKIKLAHELKCMIQTGAAVAETRAFRIIPSLLLATICHL